MSTESRYALIGLDPETRVVQVITTIGDHLFENLRDMAGLFVAVTSAEHAREIWGKKVDIDQLVRHCTTGKAMTDGARLGLQRSGTG